MGEVGDEPLGSFHYNKRLKTGEVVSCKVHVFTMEVVRQRRTWAEKNARETRWCSLEEALTRVTQPGLRRLIMKFAKASHRRVEHRVPARTAAAP